MSVTECLKKKKKKVGAYPRVLVLTEEIGLPPVPSWCGPGFSARLFRRLFLFHAWA